MKKSITINTDKRKFFRQYLTILKPVLKPHLSNGELNVLGELLYFNNEHKDISLDIRNKIIFDHDTKIDITNNLNISQSTLGNILTSLRKKKYLIDNKFRKGLDIYPGKNIDINYKFNIE
jgi:hypothetical protein